MTLNEFQEGTRKTRQYKELIVYPALGLAGEAGEVADQVKKMLRNEEGSLQHSRREKIIDELGDTLYYLAALADDVGVDLEDVARRNQVKLQKRLEEGTIKGR